MTGKALITLGFLTLLQGGEVRAEAPQISLRPVARGQVAANVLAVTPMPEAVVEPAAEKPRRKGLFRSLHPTERKERKGWFGGRKERGSDVGKLCGDRDLQGEAVGRVAGRVSGCGIESGVRLRSVAGVALSQPATLDCTTAKALKTWIDSSLKPAVRRRGGGVAEIRVAAHYACRTRNNQKGAKISEHGRGRAIDISGIRLKDGSEISVLRDWGKGRGGKILKAMRKGACGPFGTVLGPGSDRYHSDHLHFDTARYRSGPYCR